MKSIARDERPNESSPPLTLVTPQSQSSLTEQGVLLALVLAGLVGCAYYAGNAPFGAAAALSLALLGRASYLAASVRIPQDVRPLRSRRPQA